MNQSPIKDATDSGEDSLFEIHKKIHPRSISGRFTRWRLILLWLTQLIFFGLCWVNWNGRQLVLLDIAERKFFFFGWVFWPQDVIFLTGLLIISAYALFLFTAIAGRLWCGYACPQTVYTEIFLWLEKLVEGDRNARIKLDEAKLSAAKLFKRGVKYILWIVFALWTGFTFIGYFSPMRPLLHELAEFSLGPWQWFWFLFYSAFTYLLAGHLREQVCKYMCPYARFQGVMYDPDTLVVTYDAERGEPRGVRRKEEDYKAVGKGDCVDCDLCVAVCPTGIDIRDGLQYECIGCSACIDACDQVMDKMGYPRGLVRYSTEHAIAHHWGWREIISHVLRPRIAIYTTILGVIVIAFFWGLAHKPELRVDVIRDRGVLAREVEGDLIENVYRLQVMNVSEDAHSYQISVSGLPGIQLVGDKELTVPAATVTALVVAVRAPTESGKRGSNTIYFDVKTADDNPRANVHEKATYLIP